MTHLYDGGYPDHHEYEDISLSEDQAHFVGRI
jgi:hypothetical protein